MIDRRYMGEAVKHEGDSVSAADRVSRLLPALAAVGGPMLAEIILAARRAVGAIGPGL